MSKAPSEIKPNYGPVYAAAMYPELAGIFQRHGYALAVHGSLARDFDLIAVPWAETVSDVPTILAAVEAHYAVNILRESSTKNHGRIAYTLCVGFGHCAIDLSFLPTR